MGSNFFPMAPGLAATRTATARTLFIQRSEVFLAQGRYIDGASASDCLNTANVTVLRPGLVMGKITSSGLYANSFYGRTQGAVTSIATSVTLTATAATELVRRKGSTGTFKLTGPPTASGTVRTLTATYSAVNTTTGVVTITALGVNAVFTLNFANSPAGTFRLRFPDLNGVVTTTGPITYNSSAATLVTNINAALDTAFGSTLIVSSGSSVTAIAVTFSGAGYTALPQTLVVDSDGLTAGTVAVTSTTAGVDGRFVTASLAQPVDGSETPLAFISDWNPYGVAVADSTGTRVSQIDFPLVPVSGVIDWAQILDAPADASLITWLQGQLSTAGGGKFTFSGSGGLY